MKKKKLLAALMICTTLSLQANALADTVAKPSYGASAVWTGLENQELVGVAQADNIQYQKNSDGSVTATIKNQTSTFGVLTNYFGRDNRADGDGDHVALTGLNVKGSSFTSNTGTVGGAMSLWQDGRAVGTEVDDTLYPENKVPSPVSNTILNTTFTSNTAKKGGAIAYLAMVDFLTQPKNTISDATFTGNRATGTSSETHNGGGAIYAESVDLTINNSTFTDNSAITKGGAILYKNDCVSTITNSTFSNNTAQNSGGGAIFTNGLLEISSSVFTDNTASLGGAITFNNENADYVIKDSVFGKLNDDGTTSNGNKATNYYGGAIYVSYAKSLTLENSEFYGNSAKTSGGAIYSYANLAIKDSKFINNIATTKNGGALYIASGTESTLNGTTFIGNSGVSGGAIMSFGKLSLSDVSFDKNTASSNGGAINTTADLIVSDSTFKNNTAAVYGGAIYTNANLEINKSTFTNNSANTSGGAICKLNDNIGDTFSVVGSTFDANTTTTNDGGAIYTEVATTIKENSEFKNNVAGGYGGAIYSKASVEIDNSSFSNNSSERGGALFSKAVTTISNSTFDGNNATYGGGIWKQDGGATLDINNTIFTNNTATLGAGVYNSSSEKLSISNSSFGILNEDGSVSDGNTAAQGGGILTRSLSDFNYVIFAGNNAYSATSITKGGALVYDVSSALVESTITNSTFVKNTASSDSASSFGGAIWVNKGTLKLDNVTFNENSAKTTGGAIAVVAGSVADLKVENSTFTGNSAQSGGAIANFGIATINKSTFSKNKAIINEEGLLEDNEGGGALMLGAEAVTNIVESSFLNNETNFKGGAIATRSASLANNSAAKLDISGSTFTGNIAATTGGAIDNYFYNSTSNSGYVTVIDSSFSNNSAQKGGAVYNHGELDSAGNNAALMIANSTFSGNSARQGGAIYNGGKLALAGEISFSDNTDSTGANDIYNAGSLTVKEHAKVTMTGGLSGNGSTVVEANGSLSAANIEQGSFTNSGEVSTYMNALKSTALTNDGELNFMVQNSDVFEVENFGTVTNNGLMYFLADSNDMTVTLNGDYLGLSGDFEFSNLTLKYSDNVSNFNPDTMTLSQNTILDVLNNNADVINNLNIEDTASAKIDISDKLSGTNTSSGKLYITELDLQSKLPEQDTYQIADGDLKSNIILNATLLNADETITQLEYKPSSGELVVSSAPLQTGFLQAAIDDTASGGHGQYNNQNLKVETFDGGSTVFNDLTVNGQGMTITTSDAGSLTIDNDATFILVDTNIKDADVGSQDNGAIVVNDNASLILEARDNDVVVSGTKNALGDYSSSAIYLAGAGNSSAQLIAGNGKTLVVDDALTSAHKDNKYIFSGSGKIVLNGILDPATADMNAAELVRNNSDVGIDWNLNSGNLIYKKDSYLSSDGTNSINFNGGNLDLRNGAASNISLADITISNNSNIYVDVDLAKQKMDNFGNSAGTYVDGKLSVAGLNLLSNTNKKNVSINFTKDDDLMGAIDYTGASTITTPVYKYGISYDNQTGNFNFTRGSGYNSVNPAVMASPVAAQLGGYLTQLNSYDEAFRNMDMYMLMTRKQREAMKLRNKYTAADGNLLFDPTGSTIDDKAVWVRPYTTFEKVDLKGGPKVSNVAYGSFFGGDSQLYELGHGWDGMYSIYVGYNGSHQAYDGISIYQNGGTLGFTGMAYKGNYFAGATINTGANVGEASTIYGHEDFTMLLAGVAAKTGYNWELADGKFIIQPSMQMSYSFVNTFDYTNAAGIRIKSSPLNVIQFEPGVKFIGNLKNGWQPYAGVSVIWNVMDKTDFKANDVSLPELSIKPYVRYGLGLRKTWGEVCTGFLQAFLTGGGRNGVGLQAGFRFTLGKGGLSSVQSSANLSEPIKKQINLSSMK